MHSFQERRSQFWNFDQFLFFSSPSFLHLMTPTCKSISKTDRQTDRHGQFDLKSRDVSVTLPPLLCWCLFLCSINLSTLNIRQDKTKDSWFYLSAIYVVQRWRWIFKTLLIWSPWLTGFLYSACSELRVGSIPPGECLTQEKTARAGFSGFYFFTEI